MNDRAQPLNRPEETNSVASARRSRTTGSFSIDHGRTVVRDFVVSSTGFAAPAHTAFVREGQVQDELEPRIDAGIRRALQWLAAEQKPSGAWQAGEYGDSTAATSLAILAFMAAGHVPDEGPYGRHITAGVEWVLKQQQPEGLLIGLESFHGPMYCHGIATLMLAKSAGW